MYCVLYVRVCYITLLRENLSTLECKLRVPPAVHTRIIYRRHGPVLIIDYYHTPKHSHLFEKSDYIEKYDSVFVVVLVLICRIFTFVHFQT